MRSRQLSWYESMGTVLLGVVIGATCTAGVLNWPSWITGKLGSALASWVQAIGSIAAIWFSVRASRREFRRSMHAERRQSQRLLTAEKRRHEQAVEEQQRLTEKSRLDAEKYRQARRQAESSKIDALEYLFDGVFRSLEQLTSDFGLIRTAEKFRTTLDVGQVQAGACLRAVEQVPMYLPPYTYFTPEVARLKHTNDGTFQALRSICETWLEVKQGGDLPDSVRHELQRVLRELHENMQRLRERLVKARARAMVRIEAELLNF